jgi:Fe-coproporphyrin III synthase
VNGPTATPVFQIHPSLRCNLSCRHCYSFSGPHASATLEVGDVQDALRDAATLGYRTVSVSGGEPLLWSELPGVLDYAKALGLRTTVTTNGTVLNARRLDPLLSVVDLLAISVDGAPAGHDEIRGLTGAFARLRRGLDRVRERDLPFGFIHTLTKQSWKQIEGIIEFAVNADAQLVQIHPLELVGRAADELTHAACDQSTLALVYILVAALNLRRRGNPVVQYDVLHRATMIKHPERVYAGEELPDPEDRRAEDLAVLVLEADGTVVPIAYGFSRQYAVGNIKSERLRDAWPRFSREVYPQFRDMCRTVHAEIMADESRHFVNWYEVLHDASHGTGATSWDRQLRRHGPEPQRTLSAK